MTTKRLGAYNQGWSQNEQTTGHAASELKGSVRQRVEGYFIEQRFSKTNHLGLGDIRLTIGQQEEILAMIDVA